MAGCRLLVTYSHRDWTRERRSTGTIVTLIAVICSTSRSKKRSVGKGVRVKCDRGSRLLSHWFPELLKSTRTTLTTRDAPGDEFLRSRSEAEEDGREREKHASSVIVRQYLKKRVNVRTCFQNIADECKFSTLSNERGCGDLQLADVCSPTRCRPWTCTMVTNFFTRYLLNGISCNLFTDIWWNIRYRYSETKKKRKKRIDSAFFRRAKLSGLDTRANLEYLWRTLVINIALGSATCEKKLWNTLLPRSSPDFFKL